MRDMWTATYAPRSAFVQFLEQLRARSVEHICSADELVSVNVMAIRLRVMTQVVFGTAGIGRANIRLLRVCLHIRFYVSTRICYVADFVSLGEFSGEHSSVIPGVFLISSVEKSDCTRISCEVGGAALSFSASKIGCS